MTGVPSDPAGAIAARTKAPEVTLNPVAAPAYIGSAVELSKPEVSSDVFAPVIAKNPTAKSVLALLVTVIVGEPDALGENSNISARLPDNT